MSRRAFTRGAIAAGGGLMASASVLALSPAPQLARASEASAQEKADIVAEPFVAASLQFNPKMYELDDNIDALCEALGNLFVQTGARLVVAPEMCTTGYDYTSRADIAPYVDTIPGKATEAVGKLCASHGAYVVFGMAERDPETDVYYNAAVLVGPDGVVGKYRKTHQWETEEHWAAWGDLGFSVFDTELGRIGISICMDAAYMESARCLAVSSADIMCFPTNSSAQAIAALPARAVQNGMYIVSGNRSNTEPGFHMIGGSAIWSPTGEPLSQAPLVMTSDEDMDETTWYTAEIDPAAYDNANKARLSSRRPELYQNLLLHIGPWDYTATSEPSDIVAVALQYEPAATRTSARSGSAWRWLPPPFFGVRNAGILLCTLDGVRIDTQMRALCEDGSAIEGLYVVGNDSGCYCDDGCINTSTGNATGRSLTFGRRAGKMAAAR